MPHTAFSAPGRFYRGNLHGHTTASDGLLDAKEVCERYRAEGYDFVALTDHFVELFGYPITNARHLDRDDFCTLMGAELHSGSLENGELWHILAVGLPADFTPSKSPHMRPVPGQETGPEIAARARDASAFVAIAHPEWSAMSLADAQSVQAAHAIEIYNHSCEADSGRGSGSHVLDQLLSAGRRITLCATDDSHFKSVDAFGGWVMVKARENTPAALLEAMKAGQYYASSGPEFYDVIWEDRWVTATFSPVEAAVVQGSGSAATSVLESGQTKARIRLDRFDASPWMRLTVRDGAGGKAWTQPHFRPAPALG